MALRIFRQADTEGKIEPGFTISEATGGNTGIAFAALGRMLGHPVKIFMPDWMSQEACAADQELRRGNRIGQQKGWRVPGQYPDVRRVCGVA
jgi:hypothetical protein